MGRSNYSNRCKDCASCRSRKRKEAIIRLARVGYDHVAGFLDGGINAWEGEDSTIHDVSVEEGVELIKNQSKLILDVRKPGEVETAHVFGSQHIRLQELPSRFSELEKDAPIAIYCAGGYRSMIAASFCKNKGFQISPIYKVDLVS